MKCFLFIIFLSISLILPAQETDENINNSDVNKIEDDKDNVDYDKTGIILSIGAFDYFSIGVGLNIGSWGRAGPHFYGSNYGILIEYKTLDEFNLWKFIRRCICNVYGCFRNIENKF